MVTTDNNGIDVAYTETSKTLQARCLPHMGV